MYALTCITWFLLSCYLLSALLTIDFYLTACASIRLWKQLTFHAIFTFSSVFNVLSERSKFVSSFKWNSMYSLNTSAYSVRPARQAVSHVLVISSLRSFLSLSLSLSHTHTHTHTLHVSLPQTSFLGFFDELGTAAPTHTHLIPK